MIDFMSGLISSTFTRYTVTDIGEIRLLKPRFDPDALRFDIPRDYHGEGQARHDHRLVGD